MDLILIGGVSGSGKNVALAALEDSGYYAVNNLPLPLLVQTAEYLARHGTRSRRRRARRQDRARPAGPRRRDRGAAARRLAGALRVPRHEGRHAGQALLRDAPPPSVLERRAHADRGDRVRARPPRRRALARHDVRHERAARDGAARVGEGVPVGRPVEAHAAVRVVRLQARRAARRRPRVRRPLPAQSALRAGRWRR